MEWQLLLKWNCMRPWTNLKSKIRDKEGIPRERQHLYYCEKQLEEGQKLQYYKLKKGSNIMLLLSFGDLFQVFVKTLSGRTITFKWHQVPKWRVWKPALRIGRVPLQICNVSSLQANLYKMDRHFCIITSQMDPLLIQSSVFMEASTKPLKCVV